MVCKFCNAEIADHHRFCPECGKRQIEDAIEENASPELKKKTKGEAWKLALVIVGFVAAAGILAVILLNQFGISLFKEADIYSKDTYVAEEGKIVEKADVVVATMADVELKNAVLQIFCVEEFEAFLGQYYSYISYIGLDLAKPLSEQACYFDESMNWEQFMLQAGLESWQGYVQLNKLAEAEGFALDAELQQTLASFPQSIEEDAKENGFDSADALLKDRYGENCSMDVYMEYLNLVFKGNAFYSSQFEVTDEQIEAAFTEHEAEFAEKGITKTSALVSSVRHILIEPEGGTEGENGLKTYTEQEWAAGLAEAEKVLNEWKSGEATEETFKEFVNKYTDDVESKPTGGLYDGVMNDGTYMKEFQDWAIDMSRTTGETGIVKTDYGYHIMYFVEGEPEWIYYAEGKVQDKIYQEVQTKLEAIKNENPVKIKYGKIAIDDIYEQK